MDSPAAGRQHPWKSPPLLGLYVALNAGLLTTATATALSPVIVDLSPVNTAGIAIQMTAVAMFVLAVWRRVGFVPDEIRAHRQRRDAR